MGLLNPRNFLKGTPLKTIIKKLGFKVRPFCRLPEGGSRRTPTIRILIDGADIDSIIGELFWGVHPETLFEQKALLSEGYLVIGTGRDLCIGDGEDVVVFTKFSPKRVSWKLNETTIIHFQKQQYLRVIEQIKKNRFWETKNEAILRKTKEKILQLDFSIFEKRGAFFQGVFLSYHKGREALYLKFKLGKIESYGNEHLIIPWDWKKSEEVFKVAQKFVLKEQRRKPDELMTEFRKTVKQFSQLLRKSLDEENMNPQ